MSRDKILGLAICAISLLAALAAGTFFVLSGESFSLAVFVAPSLGFLVGLAIFFFSFVQENLQITDEIMEFPKLVEDDIQKIRGGFAAPAFFLYGFRPRRAVLFYRQSDRKRRTGPDRAVDLDIAAHQMAKTLADNQTEAGAAVTVRG